MKYLLNFLYFLGSLLFFQTDRAIGAGFQTIIDADGHTVKIKNDIKRKGGY